MEFRPYEYQQYCIDRVINDSALGLFLGMGLGKTAIVLSAVAELKYNRFLVSRVLVIAPKKVAEDTWTKEAEKWDHLRLLRVQVVLGDTMQRLRALFTPADIYVINRENVPWLVNYYQQKWPFDMVVVDELSSFKNHKAKRFKSLVAVRDYIKRIVGLTGTPAANGLIDLWAQVYLLDQGERLGRRIGHYRERYFNAGNRSGYVVYDYKPKSGAFDAVYRAISDICISMKEEDYLQLPDISYVYETVYLDAKAAAEYHDFEKTWLLQIDENVIDAGSAAAVSNKLLQLCNGAVYDEDKQVCNIHDCKVEAFMELVEQLAGQPALVFYNFKHDLSRLLQVLAKTKLKVRQLKGAADAAAWNDRQVDILLAHPASAAYGLNLQAGGNQVIWFGMNWSLELYQQANKRLHRQGQTEKVIIHHLVVAGGRDEDVMAALEIKSATQADLIDSLKARIEKVKSEVKASA